MTVGLDVKALATSSNRLRCRSRCVEPHWRVYLGETSWADGSSRTLAIFECLSCSRFRYIDVEPPASPLPMPIGKPSPEGGPR